MVKKTSRKRRKTASGHQNIEKVAKTTTVIDAAIDDPIIPPLPPPPQPQIAEPQSQNQQLQSVTLQKPKKKKKNSVFTEREPDDADYDRIIVNVTYYGHTTRLISTSLPVLLLKIVNVDVGHVPLLLETLYKKTATECHGCHQNYPFNRNLMFSCHQRKI